MRKFLFLIPAAIMACNAPQSGSTDTEEAAVESTPITGEVSFLNLTDGDTLTSPFYMEMGISGMEVEPKGESREGFGHHHLLINDGPIDAGLVIIADSAHIHYGGGQTSDSVALSPGEYDLTLQFADGIHVSYGPDWSKTIHVVVQ